MKKTKSGKLTGRRSKYRGKIHGNSVAVRLTEFATVQRFRGMEARNLTSFYDYVEELIREDVAKLGFTESAAAAARREGEAPPKQKKTRRPS